MRSATPRPTPGVQAVDSTTVSRDKKDHIALSDEHNSRGIELADRGWLDEAVKEFQKAIELDPNSAHAHDNLATVYSEKKLFREALHEYLTALRLEPDSATAHYNLACFLATHGPDMAVAEYQEAIELDPEYPDAHLNLGLTYADQEQARGGDEGAAAARSSSRPRTRSRATSSPRILMDEGDYRAAIAQLKEVVRLEPENFEAQLDLGICYAQKGFYAEAERAYAKARGAAAGGPPPRLQPRRALRALGQVRPTRSTRSAGRSRSTPRRCAAGSRPIPMFDALKGTPEFEALAHG